MSYRNKTYVIFDWDKDRQPYAFMKGWKFNQNVDFNFHDAHDFNNITDLSNVNNTKRKLRERMANTKQAIVLVGESTKYLYKFVRWEINEILSKDLPIVVVNLNKMRSYDANNCPAILRNTDAMHVSFNARIIQYALDEYCQNFDNYYKGNNDNWYYKDEIYENFGL